MAEKIRIGTLAEFSDGELNSVKAGGTSIIVALVDGSLHAAWNQCPRHNSRFNLCTGENLDWAPGFAGVTMPRWSAKVIALGKKPAPLTTYPVTVEGEDAFITI